MNKAYDEYLAHWLFRAREDIAVMDNLFHTDPVLYASTIYFHAQ